MPESVKNSGKVAWRCPSNIALIKYWGKHGDQLPNNASISITLQNAFTETIVTFEFDESINNIEVIFEFGQQRNESFESRVNRFLLRIQPQMPFLRHLRINIESKNNFPHSAGIASSASGFGSLALCICSIEELLFGQISGFLDFRQKASYLARIGSGSACRSIYGGFSIWGQNSTLPESSDVYAVDINHHIHPVFQDIQDSILLVSSEKKQVSSSDGHALMEHHAYARIRYQLAESKLQELITALQTGDMEQFILITESEAVSLHALMMLSESNYILLKPNTLAIIEKVQRFRAEHKLPMCFTLDAGPNIHLLYPESVREEVQNFINDELLQHCEHKQWIHDRIGKGPVKLDIA